MRLLFLKHGLLNNLIGNNFTRGEDIKWKKTIVKRAVPVFFLMKG